jgi:hypothetical protein
MQDLHKQQLLALLVALEIRNIDELVLQEPKAFANVGRAITVINKHNVLAIKQIKEVILLNTNQANEMLGLIGE